MTSDRIENNVEPLSNLHRVSGANPANEQASGSKYQKRNFKNRPKPDSIDEELEKESQKDDQDDFKAPDFHVIDYKA
jgi:hypothetical protein